MVRIYPNHLADYMEVFNTISDELAMAIRTPPCANACWTPSACNSKCAMGYDFVLEGQRQQKNAAAVHSSFYLPAITGLL